MPTALTSETLVNVATAGDQVPAGVAALTDGDSVVAWIDAGQAKLRLLDINGQPTGGEITVGSAANVQVASLTGGGFVAVWFTGPAAPNTVQAQIYDAAGHAVGAPTTLAAYNIAGTPTLGQTTYGLEVSGLSDGGYVTGWSSVRFDSMGFTSVSSQTVVADAAGQIEANAPRQVESSNKTAPTDDPDVTFVELPGGRFLATWRDAPTFGPGISDTGGQMGQLYDLHGTTIGNPFRLDALIPADGGPTIDPRLGASVALTGSNVAYAWNTNGTVWMSLYPTSGLGSGSSAGRTQPVALGAASTSADAGEPQIVTLSDGRLFVAWTDASGDVEGRLVGADGVAQGAAFVIGDAAQGAQDLVDVALRPDGALVAVWRDASGQFGDASGTGVVAQVIWPDAGGQVGTANADTIFGSAGSDLLVGRGGADVLIGGASADTLSGGAGGDKFVLQVGGGADRIVDFQRGQDSILLFDANGNVADGSRGLLQFDVTTHVLSWDPDSDAGPAAAQAIGVLPDLASLTRGDFAAGFQPSGLRVQLTSGGHTDTVFDWSGQSFDTATATYLPSGALKSYEVRYDNGGLSLRTDDVEGKAPDWATVIAEYDPQGQLFAYTVLHDDGSRTLWQYDTTSSKPWSRVLEEYDPLGRLSQQSAAMDDGTAWERHHDTYDTQPWAYYIDNFAGGRLLNHTFYNANGTVFAG